MTIRILCVGRIKERFYSDAVAEYCKRLTRYAKVEIVEVDDEKTPERASETERRMILDREGERLLKKIHEKDYVVALAIAGKSMDSLGFATFMGECSQRGLRACDFVIGGSLGLSEAVLSRADRKLSFSAMTFPHQLMRVILVEQIYRAFRILAGEPYHK